MGVLNKELIKQVVKELKVPKYIAVDVLDHYATFGRDVISKGTTEAIKIPYVGKFVPIDKAIAYVSKVKRDNSSSVVRSKDGE